MRTEVLHLATLGRQNIIAKSSNYFYTKPLAFEKEMR